MRFTRFRAVATALALLAIPVGTSHAGLFGEHKRAGDNAFKRVLAEPRTRSTLVGSFGWRLFGTRAGATPPISHSKFAGQYVEQLALFEISLTNGATVGITYGDLVGLAADHAIDATMLYRGLLGREPVLFDESGTVPSHLQCLQSQIVCSLSKHFERMNDGELDAKNFELEFLRLAKEDESHFHRAGQPLDEQLSLFTTGFLSELDLYWRDAPGADRREPIARYMFESNCFFQYVVLHLLAMEFATTAGNLWRDEDAEIRALARKELTVAILFSAFADHFLQDAFAAGHLPVTRTQWTSLDENGRHDFYGRLGIIVADHRRPTPDTWRAYGDGYYHEDGGETDRRATDATARSLTEVFDAFHAAVDSVNTTSWLATILTKRTAPSAIELRSRFAALELTPVPLTTNELAALPGFGTSLNGVYYALETSASAQPESESLWLCGGVRVGLGMIISKQTGGATDEESDVWLGLHVGADVRSLRMEAPSRFGVSFGPALLFDDWLHTAITVGHLAPLGPDANESSSWYLAPSIGWHVKPPAWTIGLLVGPHVEWSAHSSPTYGLRLEARHY